jgi:hypothetical protein
MLILIEKTLFYDGIMVLNFNPGGDEMDDSKIADLRQIHRNLAKYLKKQHKANSNCLLAVAAIREALKSHPELQKAYKASLRDLSEGGTALADQDSTNTLETLLKSLTGW